MRVELAHVRIQGVDVAVFDAKPISNSDPARQALLGQLTARARIAGLRVQKSALAYVQDGEVYFFGTPDLVAYLQKLPVPPSSNRYIEV